MAMNASAEGAEPALDVDMTPLIDVTFLLLIFFMVISAFNEMERTAELELPQAFQAMIEEEAARERMIINVEEDGQLVAFNQYVSMERFEDQLEKYAAGLKRMQERTGEAPILIRGDKNAEYRHVRRVIGAVYDHEFEKVMFAAYQREQEN